MNKTITLTDEQISFLTNFLEHKMESGDIEECEQVYELLSILQTNDD